MIEVVRIPILTDNYVWLAHDDASGGTVAIDPGEAAPVLAAAEARGWTIGQVWNTHWHRDHTGGNAEVKAATGCTIVGPAAEAARIQTLDVTVAEGDVVRLGAHAARILAVAGHTAGHIAFHFADARLLFPGDTLFAMGCGRLFEGMPEQMWDALSRLAALPPETIVYPAHEYTQANGRFALTVEADNPALVTRMQDVDARRARGEATLPTTIALERATNPFVRADGATAFARLRAAKDVF